MLQRVGGPAHSGTKPSMTETHEDTERREDDERQSLILPREDEDEERANRAPQPGLTPDPEDDGRSSVGVCCPRRAVTMTVRTARRVA